MNSLDQLVMRSMHEYVAARPGIVRAVERHLHSLGSDGVRTAGIVITAVGMGAFAAGAAYGFQAELVILKSAGIEAMHSYRDLTANLPAGTSAAGLMQYEEAGGLLRGYVGSWVDLPLSGLKVAWAGAAGIVGGVGLASANLASRILSQKKRGIDDYNDDLRHLNALVDRAIAQDPSLMDRLFAGGRAAAEKMASVPWHQRRQLGLSKELVEVARFSTRMATSDYGVDRAHLTSPLNQVWSARKYYGLSNGGTAAVDVPSAHRSLALSM